MRRPTELTAIETITATDLGDLTAETLLRASQERIADQETDRRRRLDLRDSDAALAAAREMDAGRASGPMRGLPFGAKGIIDTADFPTECGSPIYAG